MFQVTISVQGAVVVSSTTFLHLSPKAFILDVDCKQKYPEHILATERESFTVALFPSERTKHLSLDCPKEEDGDWKTTFLEVSGLPKDNWVLVTSETKWGLLVVGVVHDNQIDPSLFKLT